MLVPASLSAVLNGADALLPGTVRATESSESRSSVAVDGELPLIGGRADGPGADGAAATAGESAAASGSGVSMTSACSTAAPTSIGSSGGTPRLSPTDVKTPSSGALEVSTPPQPVRHNRSVTAISRTLDIVDSIQQRIHTVSIVDSVSYETIRPGELPHRLCDSRSQSIVRSGGALVCRSKTGHRYVAKPRSSHYADLPAACVALLHRLWGDVLWLLKNVHQIAAHS